jgi:catechol 2,3-dioxygenase-like lactoylglutathione lyase family enzyme
MKRITPNLIVDKIEDCLPFWVDRLGFETTVQVPHGNTLGFVILERGPSDLMLQSRASLEKDVPEIADGPYRSVVYFEVSDLGSIRDSLKDWPKAVPERTTFYGAREIIVRDPAGHVIFFSSHGDTP